MITLLNLLILVVGATATLAAFGGKTWLEGHAPIAERITGRGYISLLCLTAALLLGTAKEIHSRSDERQKSALASAEKSEESAQAKTRQAELAEQLAKANAKADLASQKLEYLGKINELTQKRLSDSKTILSNVQNDLAIARTELGKQSTANVVSTLASGNRQVKDIMFVVPLTSRARAATNLHDSLLPKFGKNVCDDLAGAELDFTLLDDTTERIYYFPGDNTVWHEYFSEDDPKVDGLVQFIEPNQRADQDFFLKLAQQKSTNDNMVMAAVRFARNSLSAARLFAGMQPGAKPFYITIRWPRAFRDKTDIESAEKVYPAMIHAVSAIPSARNLLLYPTTPFPSACSDRARLYLRSAFEGAVMLAVLDQAQNETMIFSLKALPPVKEEEGWTVGFAVRSLSMVTATEESLVADLFSKLPDGGTSVQK